MGWLWLLWVIGWVAALDGIRRPRSQWLAADREKAFWVTMLIIFGPLMFWIYLVGCLPKLPATGGNAGPSSSQFHKQPNNQWGEQ